MRSRSWFAIALCLVASSGRAAPAVDALPNDALYSPPACGAAPFSDVSAGDPYCPWIQQLAADQITAGCGGGNYCPDAAVTRRQIAALLERAMRGTASWDPANGNYVRTLIVHPVLAGQPPLVDALASGQRLLDILASVPLTGEYWLLKLEPGTYDLGAQSLVMKYGVDIEGSGSSRSVIRASSPALGAVVVAADGFLRHLGLELVATGGTYAALRLSSVTTHLEDVQIDATGDTTTYGVQVEGTSLSRLVDVGVYVHGGGGTTAAAVAVLDDHSSAEMHRGQILAEEATSVSGVLVNGGEATIDGAQIFGQSGTNYSRAVAFLNGAQGTLHDIDARGIGGVAAAALYALDSQVDVDAGKLYSFSGTTSRAIDCATAGSGSNLQVERTLLQGQNHAFRGNAGCVAYLAFDTIAGPVSANGASLKCAASVDSVNNFFASTCP
jgi:hypothetical protein